MFRKIKSKEKEISDTKEEDKHPSEKLVQEKMKQLQTKADQINNPQKIDISTIPKDLSDLEQEIQQEDALKKQEDKKTRIYGDKGIVRAKLKPEIKDILPVWVEKPIYYITPPTKLPSRVQQWLEAWAPFLLQWSDAKDLYIVPILDLMKEFPFKNPVIKKALTKDQLIAIGDHLVTQKTALWKGKNKTHLRLFWEDPEQTAESIFQWTLAHGQQYVSTFDLIESKQPWSNLPSEELYEFLIILVKKNKAQWADKKREMVYVLFPV